SLAHSAIPATTRIVLAAYPLRQERHRSLRPHGRDSNARAADGRRTRRHGCGRIPTRRTARRFGRRTDVLVVRGDLPPANSGAGALRILRASSVGGESAVWGDA